MYKKIIMVSLLFCSGHGLQAGKKDRKQTRNAAAVRNKIVTGVSIGAAACFASMVYAFTRKRPGYTQVNSLVSAQDAIDAMIKHNKAIDKTSACACQALKLSREIDEASPVIVREMLERLTNNEFTFSNATLGSMRDQLIEAGNKLQAAHNGGQDTHELLKNYYHAQWSFNAMIAMINAAKRRVYDVDPCRTPVGDNNGPDQLPEHLRAYITPPGGQRQMTFDNPEQAIQNVIELKHPSVNDITTPDEALFYLLIPRQKGVSVWPGRESFYFGKLKGIGARGLLKHIEHIYSSSNEIIRDDLKLLIQGRKFFDNGTLPSVRKRIKKLVQKLTAAHNAGDKQKCQKIGKQLDQAYGDRDRVLMVIGIVQRLAVAPYEKPLTAKEIARPKPPAFLGT